MISKITIYTALVWIATMSSVVAMSLGELYESRADAAVRSGDNKRAVLLYTDSIVYYAWDINVGGVDRAYGKVQSAGMSIEQCKSMLRMISRTIPDNELYVDLRRQIRTKYRLIKNDNEQDLLPVVAAYDVPVTSVSSVGIPVQNISVFGVSFQDISTQDISIFNVDSQDISPIEIASIGPYQVVLISDAAAKKVIDWEKRWNIKIDPETTTGAISMRIVPSVGTSAYNRRQQLIEKISRDGFKPHETEWLSYWSDVNYMIKLSDQMSTKGWTTFLTKTDKANAQAWENAMNLAVVKPINRSTSVVRSAKRKFIGEFVTPSNSIEEENQNSELEYFRSIGYDGVMVVWYGEEPTKLISLVKQLASDGWIIKFAYGTFWAEQYHDYSRLQEIALNIADICDGIVPLWRGASPNDFAYKTKDRDGALEEASSLATAICSLFSSLNPMIKSYGTKYVSAISGIYDAPVQNSYGTIVYNIGIGEIDPELVKTALAGDTVNSVLVIGPRAYYRSIRRRLDVTDIDARNICRFIENNMLSKDQVDSTVTLVGDGYPSLDKMTVSKWSTCGWTNK